MTNLTMIHKFSIIFIFPSSKAENSLPSYNKQALNVLDDFRCFVLSEIVTFAALFFVNRRRKLFFFSFSMGYFKRFFQ